MDLAGSVRETVKSTQGTTGCTQRRDAAQVEMTVESMMTEAELTTAPVGETTAMRVMSDGMTGTGMALVLHGASDMAYNTP